MIHSCIYGKSFRSNIIQYNIIYNKIKEILQQKINKQTKQCINTNTNRYTKTYR